MGLGLISGLQLGNDYLSMGREIRDGDLLMTRGISATRPDLHGTLHRSCVRVAPRVYIYWLCFGGYHHIAPDYGLYMLFCLYYLLFELIGLFGLGLYILISLSTLSLFLARLLLALGLFIY